MDALTSMSTCTGYRSVLQAATLLPKFLPMVGTAIGAIKPAEVLVIEPVLLVFSGRSYCQAPWRHRQRLIFARTQSRKQAVSAKVDGLMSQKSWRSPPWLCQDAAKRVATQGTRGIGSFVEKADVIILSALVPGSLAPILITEDMVKTMKNGSVIVDVSIDQGGNCAISQPGKEIVAHGVTISAIQNIPGRLAVHSTWLYANNMVYFLDNLFKKGPTPDFDDEIVKNSLVTMDRKIHFKPALEAMGEV